MKVAKRRKRFDLSSYSNGDLSVGAIAILTALFLAVALLTQAFQRFMPSELSLLTDPFLQLPTADSVRVVWFTEFEGDRHLVTYGQDLEQTAVAVTTKLSRVREDQESRVGAQTDDNQVYQQPVRRDIWRHEAEITNLVAGERSPYRVSSSGEGRGSATSEVFSLAPLPQPGTPLKILLTSDHQLKPMTPANLQKAVETVGQVDAVFLAGDLIGIADRASEWFDDNRGSSFFPSLQGRAHYEIEHNGVKTRYTGGAIIQSAPLFSAIGNHEVMGRFSMETTLGSQFNDPFPLTIADQLYTQKANSLNPKNDSTVRTIWLKDNSFNTDTYNEIFSLPTSDSGGKKYYALTFGDVRLVVLYVTNMWRVPSLDGGAKGKYRERDDDLNASERWGYGQHIFEPISPGSPQHNWLRAELNSPEFQQAKHKIVMFHHPPHSVGDNVVPAYTNPMQIIDRTSNGEIKSVRYEYPIANDYLIKDVVPLLEASGVQLVFYGHSHIWNRFISPTGMHFLESSNVGNTYGAFVEKRRSLPIGFDEEYVATGDPNGLTPVIPAIAPLLDKNGTPLPYIASNDITAFSILDTSTSTISSYRFDTREPDSPVVKFDEFSLPSS